MKPLPAFAFAALLLTHPTARAEDTQPASPPTLRDVVDSLSEADLKDFLTLLKDNYLKPDALSDIELSRATIQGLLARLAPGASILPAAAAVANEPSPFKAEIIDSTIGYLRIGSIIPPNLAQLDATLLEFSTKKLDAIVLDLRATPAGSEFEQGAEVCKRFCPKGKILFTLRKPHAQHEQILTSKEDPKYRGLLVVLVARNTAGAAEIIAAVLRTQARAMIIGQNTRGEAVEYAEVSLPSGKLLRVAVAEAALPDGTPVFPSGLKPDLAVDVSAETTASVLKQGLESGVAGLVVESERSKMNEAALVAGRNPDLEALQALQAKKGERPGVPLRDVALQRAVDFITTINLYQKKPGTFAK